MLGIKVLQRHIDNGTVASVKGCPLARAIREHLNNPQLEIIVGINRIIIHDDNYYYKLENGELSPLMKYDDDESCNQYWTNLSNEAQVFIRDFDRDRKVLPCEL